MKAPLVVAIALFMTVPASVSAAPTEIDLTIAKTNQRVYAYGAVSPVRPERSVRVRLFHDGALLATKWDELSSEDGYGVRFARPASGDCEVRVLFRTGSGTVHREGETFPCAIPAFSTGMASITTGTSLIHEVDVQIADDGPERAYGLMYRRWLADDKGMAFLFGGATSSSFYMKNTLIPLSIAFWDATGRIVRIMDMEPCSSEQESSIQGCPLYNPETTYVGALEVNQGAFEAWGVSEGDLISIAED